jgi:hypothetical protein
VLRFTKENARQIGRIGIDGVVTESPNACCGKPWRIVKRSGYKGHEGNHGPST